MFQGSNDDLAHLDLNNIDILKTRKSILEYTKQTLHPSGLLSHPPLFLAVACSTIDFNSDVLKQLIDAGADLNYTDENGDTALHLAVQNNNIEALELLLRQKTNYNQLNNNGNTPLDLALEQKSNDLFNILLNKYDEANKNDFLLSILKRNQSDALNFFKNIKPEIYLDITLENGNSFLYELLTKYYKQDENDELIEFILSEGIRKNTNYGLSS